MDAKKSKQNKREEILGFKPHQNGETLVNTPGIQSREKKYIMPYKQKTCFSKRTKQKKNSLKTSLGIQVCQWQFNYLPGKNFQPTLGKDYIIYILSSIFLEMTGTQ